MKSYLYILASLLLIVIPISCHGSGMNSQSIEVLKIENRDLSIVLDSIIEHETKCCYYNSNSIFMIALNGKYISIDSLGERVKYDKRIIGCLEHKDHLFFIRGIDLDPTLFSKTGKSIKYTFAVSQSKEDAETGIMYIDSLDVQDNSYSYWTFIYEDGRFIYESSSLCEKEEDKK